MNTVNQPTANPTNKLTAATAAAALVSVVGLILKNVAPGWYDPDVLLNVTPMIVFALGYIVKDKPNA